MAAPMLDADTLERRAAEACGFDTLDVIQAQRAAKVRQAAPLRALRDNIEARRRSKRGEILVLITRENDGKAPPATIAETVASGDARFVAWCDEVEMKLAQLAILEDEITALTETVNRGQALLRWASAERYST